MTYHESPTIHNPKGKLVAKKHYEDAHKNDLSTTLRQPLVAVDGQIFKTVQRGLPAVNPIVEMKRIRTRYQGDYAIVRELMQNSFRSGSDKRPPIPVDIILTITPDKLKIEDNAGGVTKYTIEKVFNFGKSGWQNLGAETNPFGEGFLSFILLFNKVEVISNDVNADFDWGEIEKEYDKNNNFDINKAYITQEAPDGQDDAFHAKGKFIAIFSKPVEGYNYQKSIDQAKIYSKSLPVRSVTINGELQNNKIDFSIAPRGFIKVQKPYKDIMGIEGYFAPGSQDDYIRLYEKGLPVGAATTEGVDNYYYKLPSMMGNVNINHTFYGQTSGNRDNWQETPAINRTISLIRELAREVAISLIDTASQSAIEEYQHFISIYSTFDDIKYHIRFEVIAPEVMELVQKSERASNPKLDDKAFDEHMKNIMSSSSALNTAIERAKNFNEHFDAKSYNEREKALLEDKQKLAEQKLEQDKTKEQSQLIQQQEQVLSEESEQIQTEKIDTQQKTKTSKDRVDEFLSTRENGGLTASKWTKETFWVERDMAMVYMTEISNATYHHIPLAFAENKYQKQLFKSRDNFHHIQELKTLMTNTAKLSLAGAKNAKERRIEYILKVFIDAAGFKEIKLIIANIEFKNIIQVPHSSTKIETPMEVAAYAEGRNIYFQRKLSYGGSDSGEINGYYGIESLYPYFAYNDFDLENKSIGQGDISVFSKIRKLLAHEMAHIIYKTTDNTDAHYKAMLEIDSKFDTVISEFKASSIVTPSQDGISKKAKDRIGLMPSDNVVVTYTKGSTGELEKQQYETPKKYTKKDILYSTEKSRYYTYEDIITTHKDTPDILQNILSTLTPIGYKIGDYVSIKTTSSNAYETKDSTIDGKITGLTPSGMIQIKYPDGYTDVINHTKILSHTTPPIKPKSNEIFYKEKTGQVKSYSQLIELYSDYDPSMSDTGYIPTGFKIGDRVQLQDGSIGNIVDVTFEGVYIKRDNIDLGWFRLQDLTKIDQPTITQHPPSSGIGITLFNHAYDLIKQRPMTYTDLIQAMPEMQSYAKPQNTLWPVIKKYGIDTGLVEYTNDRPVKIKIKRVEKS